MKRHLVPLALLVLLGAVVVGVWSLIDRPLAASVPTLGASTTPSKEKTADVQLEVEADAPPDPDADAFEARRALNVASKQERVVASSPLRGLVVDSVSGVPLPSFFLKIQSEYGQEDQLTTDDTGRFISTKMPASGRMLFFPLDHPKSRRWVKRVMLARPEHDVELRVPVLAGPTYQLRLTPATVPATMLEARLARVSANFEPVHGELDKWVRFEHFDGETRCQSKLTVHSTDGLWQGETQVDVPPDAASSEVFVNLKAYASIFGTVRDALGNPVANASIRYDDVGSPGYAGPASTTTDAQGAFRLPFLLPGTGTLTVRTLQHRMRDVRVELAAAQTSQQDFTLYALPVRGSIHGNITYETAAPLPPATRHERMERVLRLSALSEDGIEIATDRLFLLKLRQDSYVGSFEFEDLPDADYTLLLGPEYSPSDGLPHVKAGGDPLELRIQGHPPRIFDDAHPKR